MRLRAALLFGSLLAIPGFGQIVLFDSTADVPVGTDPVNDFGPIAFSFTTTAVASSLSDVQIALTTLSLNQDDALGQTPKIARTAHTSASSASPGKPRANSPSVTVALYSNNVSGPRPGSLLAVLGTLNDTSLTNGIVPYDFVPTTPYSLAPNTRYWIYVSTSNGSIAQMSYSSNNSGTGVPGEYVFNADGPGSNSNGPYIAMVTATPGSAISGGGNGALAHFAAGGTWTTGIFVVNTGAQAANYSILFYGDTGAAVSLPFSTGSTNNLSGSVPGNGSQYFEASNPQGNTVSGWGSITADPSVVVQAVFRNNVTGTYYEAAVPSTTGSKEFLLPFDATTFAANNQPFYTGFAIANLDMATMANITCTARTTAGTVIPNAISLSALNPLGHWAGYLFPALAGKMGTIDCVSNTNVAATAFRFIGNNAFSSLPIISNPAALASHPQASSAIAHFAAGGTWTTGIFVINTGGTTAQFSISFFGDSGSPTSLPFAGGATSTLTGTVPGNGLAYFEASNAQLPLAGGWGQITAGPAVVVQALFRNNVNGTYYEAAVPSTPGSKEFEIPFDATTFTGNQQPFYTGFAIADLDPSNQASPVCTSRTGAGVVIPNAVTVSTINAMGHWAGYLFPALAGQKGTIDCLANTTIGATAFRFLGTNAFSSLPVIMK